MKNSKIDIITMHLINNFLYSLVDEMTNTVVRTSFSPLTREAFDFQCGICNVDGEIILEGEGSLLHSLAYKYVIEEIKNKFGDNIWSDDYFLENDPYSGASHLPDIYLVKPVFYKNKIIAWAVSGGHMVDVGGATPGSCACDSKEIYQEGLRIPPVKIYQKGVRNDAFFDILKTNSRLPKILLGDISAHMAACRKGENRFLDLVNDYGWDTLNYYLEALLDYSERRTREEIKTLPDGSYSFRDYLDNDGLNSDPVPINVKITISGDEISYDFTGTSPQLDVAMNNPLSTTKAMILIGLRCLISPDIPRNSGVWRPVKVVVPKGTLLNPVLPAAVAGRGLTLSRLVDTIMGAEAKIAPDKIPACEMGSDFLICIGFYNSNREIESILVETIWGGWGGRPFADGIDFNTPILLDGANQSCEINEELYPVIYNQYAYIQDTEGPGKYRGSVAIIRDWKFIDYEGTIQIRVDRASIPPYGLYGGKPGGLSQTKLLYNGKYKNLGKETVAFKKDYILSLQTAGAGGWGDPLKRDIEFVRKDVMDEKITIWRARDIYGVIINEKSMEIDIIGTQKIREKLLSKENKK